MYIEFSIMAESLLFKQLNLDNSKAASSILEMELSNRSFDIILAQDVHCSRVGLASNLSPPSFLGYKSYFFIDIDSNNPPKAVIYIKGDINATFISQCSNSHCVTCAIHFENQPDLIVASIYSPPPDDTPVIRSTILFENISSHQKKNLIIGGDFNAHSTLWSNDEHVVTDNKGSDMEILLLEHNLLVLNDSSSDPTFESSRGKSWIDLSIAGCNVAGRIFSWEVSKKETMSFHKSISFCLAVENAHQESVCFNYKKADWDAFNSQLTIELFDHGINETFITDALPDTIEKVT